MVSDNSQNKELSSRTRRWAPRVRTGCLTCRKRKVKCDELKPTCQQCLKANRRCEGYMLTVHPSAVIYSQPLIESKDIHNIMLFFPKMDKFIGSTKTDPSRELRGRVEMLLPHLPRRVGHNVVLDVAVECISAGIQDVLTHRATRGAVAQFGEFENQKTLNLYAKALSLLRYALQDPVHSAAEETLFAAFLICCFESYQHGHNPIVRKHVYGISRIIQHRGPGMYKGDFERDTLVYYRAVIAIACYLGNRPCFLSGADWQRINTTSNPHNPASSLYVGDPKSDVLLEELVTLVAECSLLVKIRHHADVGSQRLLLDRLESFNKKLGTWGDSLVNQVGGSTGNVEYTALVKKLVLQENQTRIVDSLVVYHNFALLSHRLRVALGCDDSPGVEGEVQLIAQSIRALYQTQDSLRMPFLLSFAMRAALETKDEWREFSFRAGATDGGRVLVSVDIFAQWLRATGVNFEVEK